MRYKGTLYLLGKIYSIIGYNLYIDILLLLCTLLEGQGMQEYISQEGFEEEPEK